MANIGFFMGSPTSLISLAILEGCRPDVSMRGGLDLGLSGTSIFCGINQKMGSSSIGTPVETWNWRRFQVSVRFQSGMPDQPVGTRSAVSQGPFSGRCVHVGDLGCAPHPRGYCGIMNHPRAVTWIGASVTPGPNISHYRIIEKLEQCFCSRGYDRRQSDATTGHASDRAGGCGAR